MYQQPAFSVDSAGNFIYNYFGPNTNATAMNLTDQTNTTGTSFSLTGQNLTTGTLMSLAAPNLTTGTGINAAFNGLNDRNRIINQFNRDHYFLVEIW